MGLGEGSMEDVVAAGRLPRADFWRGHRVLVTGHTGFKGGWLCHWLHELGAEVHGLALDPSTDPSMFQESNVAAALASDTRGNIDDPDVVERTMAEVGPDVVFHLAAQPLVRASFADPLGTFRTNALGTAHVLDAIRRVPSVHTAVVVTTDKVYRNHEWIHPYREDDELGGGDPYSASKSAAEIVTASYRHSFFNRPDAPAVVTARAGNVIGGGDWSPDRLVPDLLAAVDAGSSIALRFPDASRPWQHVLEPLSGYLVLAETAMTVAGDPSLPASWNFGPDVSSVVSVADIVRMFSDECGTEVEAHVQTDAASPEAQLLALDSTQARMLLGWRPRWTVRDALRQTIAWHQEWRAGSDMGRVTREQLAAYLDGSPI